MNAFAGLVADVIEFFVQNQIPFDPSYVYNDVTKAVNHIHSSGALHTAIMQDLPKYLYSSSPTNSGVATFLKELKNAGKKVNLSSFIWIGQMDSISLHQTIRHGRCGRQ
jgi:hypothetical protein